MERQHIAYALITVMVMAAVAWFAYARVNSYERVNRRREARERAEFRKRMADRNEDPNSASTALNAKHSNGDRNQREQDHKL